MKFNSKCNNCYSWKCFKNCHLQNIGDFVPLPMCQICKWTIAGAFQMKPCFHCMNNVVSVNFLSVHSDPLMTNRSLPLYLFFRLDARLLLGDKYVDRWIDSSRTEMEYSGMPWSIPWASYQIRKFADWACAGMPGTFSPPTRVTHVPWCMSETLIRGGGEMFPAFPAHAQTAILCIW